MDTKAVSSEPFTFDTVQENDDGFMIVGRSFLEGNGNVQKTLPLFAKSTAGCGSCTYEGPRKPAMLIHRVDDEKWDAFVHDTIQILNKRYWSLQAAIVAFIILFHLPEWCFPALKQDITDDNYDADAYWDAFRYYIVYEIVLLVVFGVSLFTCLRINGEGVHREIRQVKSKHAASFYSRAGIDLLYIRDGKAAFLVFRPITDVTNPANVV